MYLQSASIENYKGVKKVDLRPGEVGLFLIGGLNGAAKSSTLDALVAALGGKKYMDAVPVRIGEAAADITIELDGPEHGPLEVTRRITPKSDGTGFSDTLKVTCKSGRVSSPQSLLDQLFAGHMIDPLAFEALCELGPKGAREQRDILLRCLGIGDALDRIAESDKGIRVEREIVGRQQRIAEGTLSGLAPIPPPPATVPPLLDPKPPVDTAALTAQISEARVAEAGHGAVRERAAAAARDVDTAAQAVEREARRVADLERQLVDARANLAGAHAAQERTLAAAQTANDAVKALKTVDTLAIEMDLAEAAGKNTAHARAVEARRLEREAALAVERAHDEAVKRQAAAEADVATYRQQYEGHSAELTRLEKAKAAAVAAAPLPIPGLGISDDGVTLDGVPFSQAAASRRLRASFAIVAALRPQLRLAVCRHGERLDEQSLAALDEFARENRMQLLVEVVGTPADVGEATSIVIVDGTVKGAA